MPKDDSQISRQARWQRKQRALGLCVLCSRPAFKGWRCRKHYEQHKITMRLRYIPRVRGRYNVGGISSFGSGPTATGARKARGSGAAWPATSDGRDPTRADGVRKSRRKRANGATDGVSASRTTRAKARAAAGNGATDGVRKPPASRAKTRTAAAGNGIADGVRRPRARGKATSTGNGKSRPSVPKGRAPRGHKPPRQPGTVPVSRQAMPARTRRGAKASPGAAARRRGER